MKMTSLKITRISYAVTFFLFFSCLTCATTASAGDVRQSLECDVLIIGGGMAGLHTAFRLGSRKRESVCLFEKERRLGGRIRDVSYNEDDPNDDPNAPRIGVGGRRFHETQSLFGLAKELGINFEKASLKDFLITTRGQRAYCRDELVATYFSKNDPRSKLVKDYLMVKGTEGKGCEGHDSDAEDFLVTLLQKPTEKELKEHNDFPSYVKARVGEDGYNFLFETSRFRGDWQYDNDTKNFLDWLSQDAKMGSVNELYYPVGGMSTFVRAMERKAKYAGVKIFYEEPVTQLQRANSRYEATTNRYTVSARSVVIAVNAASFAKIQGDVAKDITKSSQYRHLRGVKVVTITQWWARPWWEEADNLFKRKVRHISTTEHCIGYMEIPTDEYSAKQTVTRTVYNDEQHCVAKWEQLSEFPNEDKNHPRAVEDEIARGLKLLFPKINIPKPLKTYVQVWPDAWYWLKAGSPFTNAEILCWALHPIPGEAISLAGESYNPGRATWSDAGIKSSIATLNANYNFDLPMGANEDVSCSP